MSSNSEVDIFRDTPVRLLGYANEVGEAFRPLIKKIWVHASYGVASSYVAADTFHKAALAYKEPFKNDNERRIQVMKVSVDTLLWQALASVIVPGFTINRVCAGTLFALRKSTKLPKNTRKWTATIVGLLCIPFIVSPIDNGIHLLMDKTVRKWLNIDNKQKHSGTE
ncbi:hypothetical protein J437_LFUL013896 [Ladona fulva]|uniref:Mitochondrial fission process protein 1 n=1 Tax=Ladona fulva TaxID=123851 RepID=A0A8K0PCD5_LADFU|nr:hypothetical protein J437_LFUL013896 [Ladona fulva]